MHALFTLINAIHGSARMSVRSRISREFIEMTLSNIIFMCVETIMEHSTCGASDTRIVTVLAVWHLEVVRALTYRGFGHVIRPLLASIASGNWAKLLDWIDKWTHLESKIHHGIHQVWLKHDSKGSPLFAIIIKFMVMWTEPPQQKHDMQIAGEEARTVHKWTRQSEPADEYVYDQCTIGIMMCSQRRWHWEIRATQPP